MKLDVGCGNNPRGDVNCDFSLVDSLNHRNQGGDRLIVTKEMNFVLCSGLSLPFKDGAFSEVYCGQVIEHLHDPLSLLRELSRVSCSKVVVETVHRFGEALDWRARKWYKEHHVSKFDRKWFARAGKVCGLVLTRGYVLTSRGFPFPFFKFADVPFEFGVEYRKVCLRGTLGV